MASLPTSYTKSTTRVFKTTVVPDLKFKNFFFPGHRWEILVGSNREGYVSFRVRAIPCLRRLKYVLTPIRAKISVEILERSGKPAVFHNTCKSRDIYHQRVPVVLSSGNQIFMSDTILQEIIHFERRELLRSSCIHNDRFRFRCTVSEHSVPLGTLSKLRLRFFNFGIFSKVGKVVPE